MFDLTNYQAIKDDYNNHFTDNDPYTAFAILKRSSAEKEYLDTQLAELNKMLFDTEKYAKGVEAKVSHEYRIEGKGVSDAEKLAIYHEATRQAWTEYSTIRKVRDEFVAMTNFLERVYFDCKTQYELGMRNLDKRQKYQ